MNNWELAWIIVGCLAYLITGRLIFLVLTFDGGPDNPVWRGLMSVAFMVLWLPGLILGWVVGLLFA